MRSWLVGLLLTLLAGPSLAARCDLDGEDLLERAVPGAGPTDVQVRLYVNDIIEIRDAAQSFTADVFLGAQWSDPRLVHNGTGPCTAGMQDIWTPELKVMNRRTMQLSGDPVMMVDPQGTVKLSLRGIGDFSFRADLSDFPFDTQFLYFDIVSVYEVTDVNFVIDRERIALDRTLSVANFKVQMEDVEKRVVHIESTQRDHAQLLVRMAAKRLAGYYTWQQLVPLLLVVLMSWIIFWIPLEHVPSRIGLAATSMLTLIAYRFAMASVLPPIPYLTRLDIFMIGSSVLVFSALATAVAVTYLAGKFEEAAAERLNLAARILVPIILLFISIAALFS